MKFFFSKKLLVFGLLLHCISINSMEEVSKPLSWLHMTFDMLMKIDYSALGCDDKLNYDLTLDRLSKIDASTYDKVVNLRLALAESNAGTSINMGKGSSIRPPSPASSLSSDSSAPSPAGSSLSAQPTYDFEDVALDVLEALNPDLLSPRSRIKLDERIQYLKNIDLHAPGSRGPDASSPRAALQPVPQQASPLSVATAFEIDPMPRSHSTTPDLMPPGHAASMPAVAENPVFSDVETKSPESPLLPRERTPSTHLQIQPAPIRPNSAPPAVEVHAIARTQSPETSHSSSESSSSSSSASSQVLRPSASTVPEELPAHIKTSAQPETTAAKLIFSEAASLQDDEGLLPASPHEHSESSSPATSPRPPSSLVPPTLENNASPREPTVPSIDLSELTLEQLKEMDPEHFTPRARARLYQLLEEKKAQMGPIDPAAVRPELAPEDNGGVEVGRSNTLIRTLEAAGVVLAFWTTTEALLAYKNMSQEEWDTAKKWNNKLELLVCKTGSTMASRPGQIKNILKKKFTVQ